MSHKADKFYIIKYGSSIGTIGDTEYLPAKGSNSGDAPRCPLCGAAIALRVWEPPFRVEIRFVGSKHGDFVGFSDILLSERMKNALQDAGVTGLEILGEAEFAKVRPRSMIKGMPRYFVGRIKSSNAVFDDIASKAEYKKIWTCSECRTGYIIRLQSVCLEQGTWQGEDLFIAKGLPGVYLASRRFHVLVEKHGFLNINLIAASEYRLDWLPSVPGELRSEKSGQQE